MKKVVKIIFACNYLCEKTGEKLFCMHMSPWKWCWKFILHAIIFMKEAVEIYFEGNYFDEKELPT